MGLDIEKAKAYRAREGFIPNPKLRLLDQVSEVMRFKHYSIRTERTYREWIRRFILFNEKRHPKEMGGEEVSRFLSDLAVNHHVAASTQNQALNALVFLYGQVLHLELGQIEQMERAQRPERLPVVLSHDEVHRLLDGMSGTCQLMAKLLYGTGLRLMECVRLRVKDVDFEKNHIVVREGKGFKDRVTILPEAIKPALVEHLKRVKLLHEKDLSEGLGRVYLPYALKEKYPTADREWGWQYVFPAAGLSRDPRGGEVRRHHANEQILQRAVKDAVRLAGIAKPASCHSLRHSFATKLLENGYDIRTGRRIPGSVNDNAMFCVLSYQSPSVPAEP